MNNENKTPGTIAILNEWRKQSKDKVLKTLVEILDGYAIKDDPIIKDATKTKPIKPASIRYVLVVPKFIKAPDKRRSDYQNEIENTLKKNLGISLYKKSVNLKGRVPVPGSKSFLGTTILDGEGLTHIIGIKEERSELNLLPGNMVPTVIGKWLTSKEMKERILTHISNNKSVTKKDSDAYKQLLSDAIRLNNVNGTIKYAIPKNDNNAEFFEVVSALNLASLLENKNNYILNNLLKMPAKYRQYLGNKPIKIYFPTDATYGLLDYFIDFRGVSSNNGYSQESKEARSLKISVKAKLGAVKEGKEAKGDTNTIKFQDLFGTLNNVDKWFKALGKWGISDLQKKQYGPKVIAYYGTEGDVTNLGTLYPVKALGDLLNKGSEKIKIKKQLRETLLSFGRSGNIKDFKNILNGKYSSDEVADAYADVFTKIYSKIENYRKGQPLNSTIITDEKILKTVTDTLPIILKTSKTPPKDVQLNIGNLALVAERTLQYSSYEDSQTKFNFYYMFYDRVLEKKRVIYSMPTRYGPDQVKFKYLSAINWNEEYKDWKNDLTKAWVSLRGKSNANKFGASGGLGISV